MVSNELKKKLDKVGTYVSTFFFLYLVIAFFLKSEYPIYNYTFNRKDAYEVLRDGLTLLAYFLAPAVVIVAFSDWRTQHVEQKVERLSEEIWVLNRKTIRKFYELQPMLETARTNIYKNQKNTLKYDIDEIVAKIYTLGGHKNIDIDSFLDKAFQITGSMNNALQTFDDIVKKIDQSIKVQEKDSDLFKFYSSGLDDDWVFDLIDEIGKLDSLNHELLKIGFTKKINI